MPSRDWSIGVSLNVDRNEITALVGADGTGKTTQLHSISGLTPMHSGTITDCGRRIERLSPYRNTRLRTSPVPEGGKPFPDMTVLENSEIGAYVHDKWKQRQESLERVYRIFPIPKDRSHQLASLLSGGERQMLAMGRSLMARPKLCLFDEPFSGLAPIIVKQLFNFIRSLHEEGITVP